MKVNEPGRQKLEFSELVGALSPVNHDKKTEFSESVGALSPVNHDKN